MSVKIVALIVSIIMPQAQPDVDHVTIMKDLTSCWVAAKEFTDHDLSDAMRERGAIGLKATCAFREAPSTSH